MSKWDSWPVTWPVVASGDPDVALSYATVLLNIVNDWVDDAPRCVVEWGAGVSTLLLAEECPENCRIVSIDCDKRWMSLVRRELIDRGLNSRVEQVLLRRNRDGMNQPYSSWPLIEGIRDCDLIFVDGRQRVDCCTTGSLILGNEGVVVLHDAERERYLFATRLFEDIHLIGGDTKTAVMRKPRFKAAERY